MKNDINSKHYVWLTHSITFGISLGFFVLGLSKPSLGQEYDRLDRFYEKATELVNEELIRMDQKYQRNNSISNPGLRMADEQRSNRDSLAAHALMEISSDQNGDEIQEQLVGIAQNLSGNVLGDRAIANVDSVMAIRKEATKNAAMEVVDRNTPLLYAVNFANYSALLVYLKNDTDLVDIDYTDEVEKKSERTASNRTGNAIGWALGLNSAAQSIAKSFQKHFSSVPRPTRAASTPPSNFFAKLGLNIARALKMDKGTAFVKELLSKEMRQAINQALRNMGGRTRNPVVGGSKTLAKAGLALGLTYYTVRLIQWSSLYAGKQNQFGDDDHNTRLYSMENAHNSVQPFDRDGNVNPFFVTQTLQNTINTLKKEDPARYWECRLMAYYLRPFAFQLRGAGDENSSKEERRAAAIQRFDTLIQNPSNNLADYLPQATQYVHLVEASLNQLGASLGESDEERLFTAIQTYTDACTVTYPVDQTVATYVLRTAYQKKQIDDMKIGYHRAAQDGASTLEHLAQRAWGLH